MLFGAFILLVAGGCSVGVVETEKKEGGRVMLFTRKMLSVLVVALALASFGCASARDTYVRPTILPDGSVMLQGGDVGPFGTDNSWRERIPPKTSPTVDVEESYERKFISYDGCADETPNRGARNIHREKESWKKTGKIPNPAAQPNGNGLAGWGNQSVGNALLPALVGAAGEVGAAVLLPGGGDMVNSIGNVEANSSSRSRSNSNAEINNSGNSNAEINHSANNGGRKKRHGGHDDHGHDKKGNCKR